VTSGQRSSRQLRIPGPLGTAVQVALIALKLARIISWSWWWVLAPLWGSVVIFVALIGGFLLLLILQGNFRGTVRRHLHGEDENC
jgi:hypothetical protein